MVSNLAIQFLGDEKTTGRLEYPGRIQPSPVAVNLPRLRCLCHQREHRIARWTALHTAAAIYFVKRPLPRHRRYMSMTIQTFFAGSPSAVILSVHLPFELICPVAASFCSSHLLEYRWLQDLSPWWMPSNRYTNQPTLPRSTGHRGLLGAAWIY